MKPALQDSATRQLHFEVDLDLNYRLKECARASHSTISAVVRTALSLYLKGKGRRVAKSSPEQVIAGDIARTLQICVCCTHAVVRVRNEVIEHGTQGSVSMPDTLVHAVTRIDELNLELRATRRQLALHLSALPPAKRIPRTRNRDMPRHDKSTGDSPPPATATRPEHTANK